MILCSMELNKAKHFIGCLMQRIPTLLYDVLEGRTQLYRKLKRNNEQNIKNKDSTKNMT